MGGNPVLSTKRMLIDKANTRIVIYVSVAAFILVLSLVATKTLISQAAYQNRVISAKHKAVDTLKKDIDTTDQLKTSYQAFTGTAQNVLGGNPGGDGPSDGNNAKIVLDALPSQYDFPGLTTSLEWLLTQQQVAISNISGTDDEVAQSANSSSSSPQPNTIPFSVSVTGDYQHIQSVVDAFSRSVRPMQIKTMDIGGGKDSLTLSITAQTYYQPAKSLNIGTKVVK